MTPRRYRPVDYATANPETPSGDGHVDDSSSPARAREGDDETPERDREVDRMLNLDRLNEAVQTLSLSPTPAGRRGARATSQSTESVIRRRRRSPSPGVGGGGLVGGSGGGDSTPSRQQPSAVIRTPQFRIYDDSLPPSLQPQTPQHLPEARHRSRLEGSYTVPARFSPHPIRTPTTTRHGRRMAYGRRRNLSPLGLQTPGFRGLYGGIENTDESTLFEDAFGSRNGPRADDGEF